MRAPVPPILLTGGVLVAVSLLHPAEARPAPGSLPPLVTRDCYGGDGEARMQHGYGGGYGGGYGLGGLSAPASQAPIGGAGASGRGGPAPTARPAPAPPPAQKAARARTEEADATALGAEAPPSSFGALDALDEGGAPVPDGQFDRSRPPGAIVLPPRGPRVEFGGAVHLSNDDSMSLASAQRLLYALEHDVPVTTSQIRPHELLNYFTFDTAAPPAGQVFGVHASAVQASPDQLTLALSVQAAKPPRPTLDLTLLVDRSGSMQADGRMVTTQRALHRAAEQLRPGDRVDLLLFDHTVCTPLEGFVVGRDDPRVLRQAIDRMAPRGSTDLDAGLKEAYRIARAHAGSPDRAPRVMLFTDAILNTGDVNPHTVSEIGRAFDDHRIRITGVGVGRDFRDDVLDRITEKGRGAYVFLGSDRVVDRLFGSGFDSLVQTVAEDVRTTLHLPPSLGLTRFYGEESSRRAEDVQPVHVHAGTSQLFLQDLAVRDARLVPGDAFTLTVTWSDPVTGARRTQSVTRTVGDALRAPAHNARKGLALMAWTDTLLARAMGQDACGAPYADWRRALGEVQADAELAYVSGLLGRWCGQAEPVTRWEEPAWTKIRLDADTSIDEVTLACPGGTQRRTLPPGDNVARFTTQAGSCLVTLYGPVPMTARLDVPSTGADVRCVARGGRLSCQ